MNKQIYRSVILVVIQICVVLLSTSARGQSCGVLLTNLPPSVENERGYTDWRVSARPGMSLNGFDCADGNCDEPSSGPSSGREIR